MCSNRFVTLRDQPTKREFGDRMQRRIFQPKKNKVVGLLQNNMYNEVLYHFTLHEILGW